MFFFVLAITPSFYTGGVFYLKRELINEIHTYPKSCFKLALKPVIDKEIIVSSYRSAAFKKWLDS
ncbi:MAG TPA: hypothetical protein PKK00_02385 [Bacteroidales bacterium]|nr:hypothetical protein [Bacteroidales bacterium]HPS15583.1 hypothetical protein [Bacteroidales bacterium]